MSEPNNEPSLLLNLEEDLDLLQEYVSESQEHLANIEQGVLVLEENPTDADTLASIFRAFHTFKGGAGFLNLTAIQDLAHILESLLDKARQGELSVDTNIIDIILAGADTLTRFIVAIEQQVNGQNVGDTILVPTLELIARVQAALSGKAGADETAEATDNTPSAETGDVVPPQTAELLTEEPATSSTSAVEPSLTLNLDEDLDLLQEYVAESREHLVNIEQGVLVLEDNPTDSDTLASIFRAFHTFKGGAGFLNLTAIQDLAHILESLLDKARQGQLSVDTDIIDIILAGADTLTRFIDAIEQQVGGENAGNEITVPTLALIARVQAVLNGEASPGATAPAPPEPAAVAPAPPPDVPAPASLENKIVPITAAQAAEDPPDETVEEFAAKFATASAETSGKAPSPPAPPAQTAARSQSAGAPTSIKVDTPKLDSLIDLVGELVISQTMVLQDPNITALQSQTLNRNLAQLRRITHELQRTAMSLRMIPIKGTFQKMTRIVRDVAQKQGKKVKLEMAGEDTELDRNLVEALGDPLVHMIRNSVDHGIEKSTARRERGKPEEGTIVLRAFHKGGNIVIQIEDDGNGIDPQRILAKGIEKGIVGPADNLSDKEIFQLLFAPGFSTAEQITDISGRGVGMDVVLRNIEKLRGKIDIESRPGKGSLFTIYLPLTLAIIDGMIVSSAGEKYILPTLSVRESFRPSAGMISTVYQRGEMVNVRGKLTPLLRLYDYFNVQPTNTDPTRGIIIVVESGDEQRCLLVDELLGKQEVVIKSLGSALEQHPALAGAAILANGRVGLILDVDSLVKVGGSGLALAA